MKYSLWIALAAAALLGLLGSVYVVREGQVALVLNLGRVARTDIGPGLHFKWPLVETARTFDSRFTLIDFSPERYLTSERKQVASALRAEGEEQARTIRAQADRDQAVTVAEAERDAQRLRGEGDAEAARLFAEAASKDPAFFSFHRSLEAYRGAFGDGQNVIVLDKDDPFMEYFKNER